MVKRIICLFLVLFSLVFGLWAERPKVGLVLAGGGAKGFAHVGVLKVLEDNGIHVDYIAGTSMGGIVGALSAYGYSAREIEKEIKSINWTSLFLDSKDRDYMSYSNKTADAKYFMTLGFDRKGFKNSPGIISGQRIQNMFYHLVGPGSHTDDFDDLPTPFRCVATDILTGKEVVLKDGSLADAMRSTMSIPGVFTPVRRGDYLLVDGMVVNNLPVSVARDMGADIIIAVNLSNNETYIESLRGPVEVANQMLNLFIFDQQQTQLKDADIIIEPALGDYDSTSYFNFDEIERLGEQAAKEMLPAIKAAVGPENISNIPKTGVLHKEPVVISRIEMTELEPYEQNIFKKKMDMFIDKPLEVDALNQVVQDFHSSGQYESIHCYVDQVDNEYILTLDVEPVKRGPHYFRAGLFYELNTNVDESHIFNILLGLEFNNLLFEGDRLENEFEVFSGITADTRYFIPFFEHFFFRPEVELHYKPKEEENLNFESWGDMNKSKTEFTVSSSLSLGTFHHSLGEVSVGVMNEYIYKKYDTDSDLFDFDGIVNSIFYHSRMDNINSVVLPERGTFNEITVKYSNTAFGSEDTYLKAKFTLWQYFNFLKRNSFGGKVFAGMDFGTGLPVYDLEWFTYVNAFPGYSNHELVGDNILGGVLDYKFSLCNLPIGARRGRVLLTLRGGYGAIYEDFDFFHGKDYENFYGLGFGIGITDVRLPIMFEISVNDDRRWMVHISAGNKF